MTVAVGWVRKTKNDEELIIASDSRLCGGHRWDQCAKILNLPRGDSAICFAGGTDYAYPMLMQVYFASGELGQIYDRAMDVVEFHTYVLKHLNQLQSSIYSMADATDIYENEFLFGGYSWKEKKYKLWRYHYKSSEKKFAQFEPNGNYLGLFKGQISIIGDQKSKLNKKIIELLREKYGSKWENYKGQGFDMEPLEALISLLRNSKAEDTIGGPPQIVKVYQHMNCRPIGVYWPRKDDTDCMKNRTLLGRKMFEFERSDYWFLDPNTLRVNKCK